MFKKIIINGLENLLGQVNIFNGLKIMYGHG
jgi:hypothetical protein